MIRQIKYLFILLFSCNTLIYAQIIKHPSNIEGVYRNDTLYIRDNFSPYTGSYKEYEVGPISVEGNYVNGLKEGEFKYYANEDHLTFDSIINYHMGKRHGAAKTFIWFDYLATQRNYSNDTLDGYCYTWWQFGQLDLIDLYKKGKLIQETECPIDYNFDELTCGIKGHENSKLTRDFFKLHDTIYFNVVGHYFSNDLDSNYFVVLDKYKLISYNYRLCSGPGDVERCWEGPDPLIISKLSLSPAIFDRLYYLEIWDILIENHCGVQYNIPTRSFRIYPK
jgi:antitoxin component YwqK of YwqJK toxin-antitoxin module